MNWVVKAAKT